MENAEDLSDLEPALRRLERAAARTGRSRAQLLEAVLDAEEERERRRLHGRLERAKQAKMEGRLYSNDEVSEWLLHLGTEQEIERPRR